MAVQKKQDKEVSAAREIAATKETSGADNKKETAPREAAKAVAKSQPAKAQKTSFAERAGGIKKYFLGVKNELKKVHWPTRKEIVTYTAVVFVSVVAVAAVIWVLDSLLSLGVSAIVS